MAALDFPDNPTNGQVFDKWTWNGTMWVLTASGSGGGGSGFTFNQDAVPTATSIGDTWYETDTGDSFVWTNDGNSTQWVQFAPGSGGGGGSGFTYVTDTKPTPSKVGDTWFDTSTLASGGTSWVAIEESPGGEKVWVQFAPGSGLGNGPRGLIGRATLTTTFGPVSTSQLMTPLQVMNVVTPGNRAFAVTFSCRNINGTPGNSGGIIWLLQNGATIAYGDMRWDAVGATSTVNLRAVTIPAAGSYNFAVYLDVAPSTTMAVLGAGASPSSLTVEDIGAV